MKKLFKLTAMALAAAMMLGVMTACGGDEAGTSSQKDSADTSTPLVSIVNPNVSSGITVIPLPSVPDSDAIELISKGAEFKCNVLSTEDFIAYITDRPAWKDADYDVSQWQTANAPLGDRVNGSSPVGWGGIDQEPHGILAVTTFEIEDLSALEGKAYSMNIFYDNTIYMYLNGNLIFSHDAKNENQENATGVDWVDAYTDISFEEDLTQYLVEGTNVLSVSLLDIWGGRELDLSLTAK